MSSFNHLSFGPLLDAAMDSFSLIESSNQQSTTSTCIVKNESIIGLHLGSRVFYCSRSTLANVKGSFFDKRFSVSRNLDNDAAYTDQNGINIFFLERDEALFSHILKYIHSQKLNLPPFEDNEELWRDLRAEADFFSLKGLSDLLHVTHSAAFNSSAKGIFHWLGSRRLCVEIEVGRFDDKNYHLVPSPLVKSVILQDPLKPVLSTPDLSSMDLGDVELRKMVAPDHLTCSLWNNAVILFHSVLIRPTYLTMRIHYDDLDKTDDNFNLEASKDGVYWDLLRLKRLHENESPHAAGDFMMDLAVFVQPTCIPEQVQSEHFMKAVDKLLRRTWQVEATNYFYKYFRFVGSKSGQYPDRRGGSLEIFGDVHED
jgi:BTB/POZ domain